MVKIRLQRRGRKKLPVFKIVAADSRFPRDGRFIESLGHYEPFRSPAFVSVDEERIMYWIGVDPLSRDRGDVGALKKAIQRLKEGACICLYPEGTRTTDGELQPAKGGIGFLIAKAGVPVVPTYIDGNFRAYPRGAKWIRPARCRVYYGRAIQPSELEAFGTERDAYEKIGQLVMSRITALKNAVDAPK